jgi:uncharacterized protein YebE (UPF0316 family)
MFNAIWQYILAQAQAVDPLTWVLLFLVSIVYDIFYTKSIIHISRLDAGAAANLSVLLYLMMAYGTINYVKNFINLIPIAIGAWIGTYGILKYERKQRNKKRREKERLKKEQNKLKI